MTVVTGVDKPQPALKLCHDAGMLRLALAGLTALGLLGVFGCASLSERAKRIRIVTKSEVKQCRFLKVVYGNGGGRKREALENAANSRATHIVVLYNQNRKYTADAFDCEQTPAVARAPEPKPEPAPTPAAATPPPALVESAPPPPPPAPAARGMSLAPREWVVAVMDVRTVTAGKGALDESLMQNIGDQLRIFMAEQGVRTVDRNAQKKEQLSLVKADSYKGCYDDNCQIELGKALAASHILRTNITQFGRLCVLNGELIDLKAEVATSAASSRGDCEEEGFLQMCEDIAKALVKPR